MLFRCVGFGFCIGYLLAVGGLLPSITCELVKQKATTATCNNYFSFTLVLADWLTNSLTQFFQSLTQWLSSGTNTTSTFYDFLNHYNYKNVGQKDPISICCTSCPSAAHTPSLSLLHSLRKLYLFYVFFCL